MAFGMDDIRYFIKVAELKNITRASEVLGLSQPTLSYSIKRLEAELGAQLLVRLKSGIELTKLGDEFLRKSKVLLHQWNEVKKVVDPESADAEGNYTIAIHPSVALYTLDKFMPKLVQEFPKINFNFIHGASRDMASKVINFDADFGIVVNPISHPDLIIKKLCTDVVTLFSRAGAPRKLIFDPDLAQSQFILKKIKKKSAPFEGELCTNNLEVAASLTAQGLGIGLLPKRVASGQHHLSQIENSPEFKDEICLIFRVEKHNNTLSKKIISTICKGNY